MRSTPKNLIKKIFLLVVSVVISTIFLESWLGYYYFQKRQIGHYTAIGTTIRRIIIRNLRSDTIRGKIAIQASQYNPFIQYNKTIGYKFHPFIDYTGAQGSYPDQIHLDYFGFRNDTDLYFDDDRHYTLIVMTGGSEAAGSGHRTTITQNLERILNKDGHKKYKVLNLAMNSYTVPNEISAYIHLAYQLKPEFVISHSGWNDLIEGQQVPYNFKRLGLNYMKNLEHWLPRLYELKDADAKYVNTVETTNPKGNNLIVENYLRNLDKYRDIVVANGGRFIVGLQTYRKIPLPEYDEVYRMFPEIVKAIQKNDGFTDGLIDFTQNEDIAMTPNDPVHSNDEGSLFIAKIYAERILNDKKVKATLQ